MAQGPSALIFAGFMGAGKSTAARHAAEALGVEAIDVDRVFEERHGPIEAFFDTRGEGEFRRLEEALVLEALDRGGVVALGGGAIESQRVREALRAHTVVLLEIDAATAWHRARGAGRPLARDHAVFEERYRTRVALYDEVADVVLPLGEKAQVLEALPAIQALPEGARMAWAATAGGAYPVAVGRGVRAMATGAPGRPFIVTDTEVAARWGPDEAIVVGAGERFKTLASAEQVWRELAARGATRGDHLFAIGGGCVTDLAGFCAATYQRGIPVVHVSTTLVGQVDAAIGGKTAVDLDGLKNYVGAYHQPAAVLADTETLETLPRSEWAAGYAEVLKTALIAGGTLWEKVSSGGEVDDDVIFACARTKLRVVGADERDGGLRQVLNLGHTVAHAIEKATENAIAHGPAVALGLLAALRLSGQEELRAQVAGLLAAHGLATSARDLDVDAVVAATRHDKKRTGAEVPFVLVEGPGDVRHGQRVDDASVRAAVEELVAA